MSARASTSATVHVTTRTSALGSGSEGHGLPVHRRGLGLKARRQWQAEIDESASPRLGGGGGISVRFLGRLPEVDDATRGVLQDRIIGHIAPPDARRHAAARASALVEEGYATACITAKDDFDFRRRRYVPRAARSWRTYSLTPGLPGARTVITYRTEGIHDRARCPGARVDGRPRSTRHRRRSDLHPRRTHRTRGRCFLATTSGLRRRAASAHGRGCRSRVDRFAQSPRTTPCRFRRLHAPPYTTRYQWPGATYGQPDVLEPRAGARDRGAGRTASPRSRPSWVG